MSVGIRYGRSSLEIPALEIPVSIYTANRLPSVDPEQELARALRESVGTSEAGRFVSSAHRVAIVIPDPTRGMPKASMLRALRRAIAHVPDEQLCVVVGYGKHAAMPDDRLGLPPEWAGRIRVEHHDATDSARLRRVGTDEFGFHTNREVAEADAVIAIGAVRPHYFAGFTGGAKAILPGVAGAADITGNHALRDRPGAWLGVADGNPARDHQEALVRLLKKVAVFNVVTNADGSLVRAAFGDLVAVHRALVPVARQIGEMPVKRHDLVIAGAGDPTAINIYQITKAVPPAALCLAEGGTLIVCGPCKDGIGGAHAVNEIIHRHTLTRFLPRAARCVLVSDLPRSEVEQTFFAHASDLGAAITEAMRHRPASAAILPDSVYLIPMP
ncbi:MAG: DUF2088 domain-containing protein [Deltaproteobacteria bacterium]|nr:DUF2088 domain-containing protein [Deltaproteobacteria bacterium]